MSKKVLALVLALVMVLGSFSFVSAADFSDVEGTVYEEAVARLSLLEVLNGYPDGSFKPENTITRAEFAAVAIRLRGLEDAAGASKGLPTGFTDVAPAHWASGYVGTAGKLGIVNGIGNGLFAPESPVKYEEAVTMIVRALGYEPSAQEKGGYPYGYLIVANEIGVLDDVKGTQGAPAPRGLVAQIADNALEIPMMIQVGFGADAKFVVSGSAEHGDEAEEQYLLEAMGFEKFEGRVQFDKDFDDQITLIDEDSIKLTLDVAEGFDFYEVEGVVIKAWYNDDDLVIAYTLEEEVLFDAVKYEDDDEINLVGADKDYDLADFDGDKDEYDLEIYFDRKEVKEKDYDKNFEADYAKVVLNDKGDVIFVDGYDFDGFIVANEVEDEEILDLNDDELDTEDFLIVKEGKTIAVEDVEEGDIVFYDDSQEFAVVFNNSVTGEVDRVYTNKNSFRLDGETYDYVSDALYLDEGELDDLDDDILEGMMDEGSEVEIFFDFKGEVVLIVGESGLATKDQYVVPTDAVRTFTGRKGNMVAFDVLNSAGEKVSYDLETADLNNSKEIDNNLGGTYNIPQGEQVLFEIKTDKDGDVTELWDLNAAPYELLPFGGTATSKGFEIDDKYVEDNDGDDYRLKSSTVVFYDYDGSEYDEVVTLGEAEGVFSEVDKGYLYIVDGEIEVVLAVETDADTDTTDYTGLVTDAYVTKDKEIEFTIEVLGKEMEFTTDEDYKLSDIVDNGVVTIAIEKDVIKLENKIVTLAVSDSTGLVDDIEVEEGIQVNLDEVNTSSRTITSGNKTYELVRNAVIYKPVSDSTISLRDLRDDYTTARVYTEENSPRFVQYVVADTAKTITPEATGTVTYITTTVTKDENVLKITLPANNADVYTVKLATPGATLETVTNYDAIVDTKTIKASELVTSTITDFKAGKEDKTYILTVEKNGVEIERKRIDNKDFVAPTVSTLTSAAEVAEVKASALISTNLTATVNKAGAAGNNYEFTVVENTDLTGTDAVKVTVDGYKVRIEYKGTIEIAELNANPEFKALFTASDTGSLAEGFKKATNGVDKAGASLQIKLDKDVVVAKGDTLTLTIDGTDYEVVVETKTAADDITVRFAVDVEQTDIQNKDLEAIKTLKTVNGVEVDLTTPANVG